MFSTKLRSFLPRSYAITHNNDKCINAFIGIIIKTSAHDQVGKTKLFISCLINPKHPRSGILNKTQLREVTTVDWNLEPIQRPGIKHSVGNGIQHSKLGRQETPWKLRRSTPSHFNLQWMSYSRSTGMSNSSTIIWKLTVKLHAKDVDDGTSSDKNPGQDQVTMGRVHSPGSTTTKALVLLGFSIMHQWLHHFWVLSSPVKDIQNRYPTAGLSAGLRTTARSVELSA